MLWLLACACPRFDEMVVSDPDGIATPDMVAAVESAIADFASWTTAEGVCVPEVVFREALENESWQGAYSRPHVPIALLPQSPGVVYDAALHELCHAWDGAAGFPSSDHPELFSGDRYDPEHYPTVVHQRSEALARACGGGREGARIQALLAERCPDVTLPGAWLLDNVFDADAATAIDDAPGDLARATVSLEYANTGAPYAFTPAGLWGSYTHAVGRWEVDGSLAQVRDLPAVRSDMGVGLGGGEAGLAWFATDGENTAVWVKADASDEFLGPTVIPRRAETKRFLLATTSDRAWFFDVGVLETSWWALALDGSGVVEDGVIDTEVGEVAAEGDRVWILTVYWFLVREGDGWEARFRLPQVPDEGGMAPLPDGGWVVPVSASGPDDTDVVRTLARFDGATWSLPPDPCGADARIAASEVRGAGGRAALVERDAELDEVRFAPLSW